MCVYLYTHVFTYIPMTIEEYIYIKCTYISIQLRIPCIQTETTNIYMCVYIYIYIYYIQLRGT